ncbi:MAG TPA: 7-cyano-7-deazaguanine synthase QueC [Fimbriimonadaceae bacterium]|nr:7-cyano-7-deazaguanine synthase QueC [Fimbriimonadaceae bacterium]
MSPRAVVLLSGGLDSTTVLAIASREFDCFALTVAYGQRHAIEIDAARRVAAEMQAREHKVVSVDLSSIGGSALTDSIEVPKDRSEMAGIPVTYVPARNTVMLAIALGYAETLQADDIFVGVNAVDYSGYPDCRPEFVDAFESLANLATKRAVEGHRIAIHAPLIRLTKVEIIRRGLEMGVDYGITRSCYDPNPRGQACGRCDSCLIRKRAFAELGMADPAPYADD